MRMRKIDLAIVSGYTTLLMVNAREKRANSRCPLLQLRRNDLGWFFDEKYYRPDIHCFLPDSMDRVSPRRRARFGLQCANIGQWPSDNQPAHAADEAAGRNELEPHRRREGEVEGPGGKAVILDFWATFCPPCIEEIPHLNSLQAKYGIENLQIVGLNVGG